MNKFGMRSSFDVLVVRCVYCYYFIVDVIGDFVWCYGVGWCLFVFVV